MAQQRRSVPGTPIFDGPTAQRGFALNAMCYSFNEQTNRDAFVADPDAYCARYGLDDEVVAAVKESDVLGLLNAGASIYYLAKLAGILGWDMQDVGARQTGLTREQFQARLEGARDQGIGG